MGYKTHFISPPPFLKTPPSQGSVNGEQMYHLWILLKENILVQNNIHIVRFVAHAPLLEYRNIGAWKLTVIYII